VIHIARLSDEWRNAFQGHFEDEEDVIEFIFEHLDTRVGKIVILI